LSSLTDKTILVVEDDPMFREGLAAALEGAGCRVILAAIGKEALNCLSLRPLPNLILLDMVLPLMDGWSFLAQFNQVPEWSRIPIVIVTGLGIASREWGATLGAIDVIKKPAEIEDFVEGVRRNC
jgi:CheY-like chemotaxis protein